jgi:ribosomal protein L24E
MRTDKCRWCHREIEVNNATREIIRSGAIVLLYCSEHCQRACDHTNEQLREGKITDEEFYQIVDRARQL